MQVGQDTADIFQLGGGQIVWHDAVAVNVPIERHLLPVPIAAVAAATVGQRYRTRKTVLAEEKEQIELTLHFDLALHLVDFDDELPTHRLEQVVRVDGPLTNRPDAQYFWQSVLDGERVGLFFGQVGVCGHLVEKRVDRWVENLAQSVLERDNARIHHPCQSCQ